MGYFANGSESDYWRVDNCDKCIHDNQQCAVELAHLLHNYDECNKPDSILHLLIPLKKEGVGNEQCAMFIEGTPPANFKEGM